jgi:hypothetical protein
VHREAWRSPAPVFTLACLLAIVGLAAPLQAKPNDRWSSSWATNFSLPLHLLRQWLRDDAIPRVARKHVVSISPNATTLAFELRGGGSVKASLGEGEVLLDGQPAGHYATGDALAEAWRQLALDATRRSTAEVVDLVHGWQPTGLSRDEAGIVAALHERFADVSAPGTTDPFPQAVPQADARGLSINLDDLSNPAALEPALRKAASLKGSSLRVTVPHGQARLGRFSIGSGERMTGHLLVLEGDADIYGTLAGNLATVDGDVIIHPGAVVMGDVLAVAGNVKDEGGDIRGEIRTLRAAPAPAAAATPAPLIGPLERTARNAAGLLGVFVTLVTLGFGLVIFARQPLEVVSDTVSHSFGRSFLVGLLGQVLLLPTFGMMVVGLILSVAGILLLPFAVIVYCLLVVVALLGGYLAVAHAMGETYTRRRMAMGAPIGLANSYRYVLVGVTSLLVLWAAWVVFGWVPVAGTLIRGAAILATWLLATVGFGASLLSRAGFRESFAGRILPQEALTDEYLWATPQFGVPAAKRPGKSTTLDR